MRANIAFSYTRRLHGPQMIGTRLAGRYEVKAELGRGGMGVVYRAHDPLLGREVAVKLVPPLLLTAEAEERFQREARVVARMDHPGIVTVHDVGRHEGALFFVMPVVEGRNLRALLQEGSLRLEDVIEAAIQAAEALEYSHARGVIHRDVKPENIMVTRDAGAVRVRVMDFGLARSDAEPRATRTGSLVGTVAYFSPEQALGAELDGRTDIFSLGTVLYECLTGEPPFAGEMQSLLYRIAHEDPPLPHALGIEVDPELERLVLCCLAKNPAGRPQRAGEVAEALRRWRGQLEPSVLARSLHTARTGPLPRPAPSAFVGRVEPFGELQRRLHAAIAGECQFAVVSGETGIGKSRLLEELEKLARARGIRALRGRFAEQDQVFAYQGFCELIQDHFRWRDGAVSGAEGRDLSDVAPDLVSLFPVLGEIPELRASSSGEGRRSAADARKAENRTYIFELLARTLARIGAGKPLLLLLENIHAAEVSLEALPYVVRRMGPTPTLIVGTYRTTEVDKRHPVVRMLEAFHHDPRFASVALGPFSLVEHRALLESILGPGVAEDVVTRLYEAAEGNPFFTKELVRSLLDTGGLSRDAGGSWSVSVRVEQALQALPETIQQAVEKRIQRLPENLREVLSIASILGRTLEYRDLEAIVGLGREAGEASDPEGRARRAIDLEHAVERLLHEGLLEEERRSRGDRLSFSSGVVRDVLYAAIPRRRRRALHRGYAEHLEERYAGRLERVYPQLVHHCAQADLPDKTVEYGLELARRSIDAFSPDEAARALRTVLDDLEAEEWAGDRSVEGEARLLLAAAHRMRGNVDGALREAEAAARILVPRTDRVAAVSLLAAETAWQGRRIEQAQRWVDRGIEAARAAGETLGLARLLALGATIANLRGEYDRAAAYLGEEDLLGPAAARGQSEETVPAGGRLVVALANPIDAREPSEIVTIDEEEVLLNVFETLLATDEAGNLVPSLCERWEALEGGRSFLLDLRREAHFHDGAPLTARDVKTSFERAIRRAKGGLRAAHTAIRGVREYVAGESGEVVGLAVREDDVLEIQLLEALAIFPAFLTDPNTAVVRAAAEDGPPVGSGPFRLASQDPRRVVLERAPSYWKGTPPLLDAIEFRASLTAAAIASGFRAGELDLARDLLPQDLEEILRDPRLRAASVEAPKKNVYFVLFHANGPVARDARVRRALARTVRTHDLVWRTLGRFAQPAAGLLPPGILGHDPGKRREHLDREHATSLLRAIGRPMPLRLKAAVHPLLQDRYGALTRALFGSWSELGVEVEVATPDMASFMRANEANQEIDIRITRWNADYDDPDDFTYSLFHSRHGVMRFHFCSPETDRLAEEGRTEARPALREQLYRRFEDLLLDRDVVVPLFHDIDYRLAGPWVRRLRLRASAPYVSYAELGQADPPASAVGLAGGGVVHVPIAGSLESLDPSLTATIEQGEVIPNVFETLTRDVEQARIVPWLATEFVPEEGGRRFRFHLREGVRFHDGRRLTARDVRYSYERLVGNARSASRSLLSPIRGASAMIAGKAGDLEGFRILSATEFTIELEKPIAFFPALVCFAAAAIIPEGSDPTGTRWREGCVGTGPFRVVRFEPGRLLELERNPAYWRAGYPKAEGLVFHLETPPARILSEFRAGRLSLASDLFPTDAEPLRQDPQFASHYAETPRLTTYFLAFNVHRGPLAHLALRQRVAGALDVDSAVRRLGRLAVPAHGLIPPGLLGYDPAHTRAGAQARTATADEAPTKAGGVELKAGIWTVYRGEYAALAGEITAALQLEGMRLSVLNETMPQLLELLSSGEADFLMGRWLADYPDADSFAFGLLHSREGFLGRYCGSTEIDRLVESARAETDPAVRHRLYREVEEIVAREVLMIPLFHEQVYRFARPEVEGLKVHISSPPVAYEELWVRRSPRG